MLAFAGERIMEVEVEARMVPRKAHILRCTRFGGTDADAVDGAVADTGGARMCPDRGAHAHGGLILQLRLF